jgi:hypothetical protein
MERKPPMLAPFTLLAILALHQPLQAPDRPPAPPADTFKPEPGWKMLGKDVWFDPKERRLIIRARVAIKDGPLEHLLCSKGSKDHESTLTTEAPPRAIQAGLLLTRAEPGHPVRFDPKFEPPSGSAISIELAWTDPAGKPHRADARSWVKDFKTNKRLDIDWVFAGSELFEDPRTKEQVFAADDGDLMTVANFPSSILDLPFRSSANDADRAYVANTDAMPDRGTFVTMFLAPRPKPEPAKAKP